MRQNIKIDLDFMKSLEDSLESDLEKLDQKKYSKIKEAFNNCFNDLRGDQVIVQLAFKEISGPFYNWSENYNLSEVLGDIFRHVINGDDYGPGLYVTTKWYDSHHYGRNLFKLKLKKEGAKIYLIDLNNIPENIKIIINKYGRNGKRLLDYFIRCFIKQYYKDKVFAVTDSSEHTSWYKLSSPDQRQFEEIIQIEALQIDKINENKEEMDGFAVDVKMLYQLLVPQYSFNDIPLQLHPIPKIADMLNLKRSRHPPFLGNIPPLLDGLKVDKAHQKETLEFSGEAGIKAFHLLTSRHKTSFEARKNFLEAIPNDIDSFDREFLENISAFEFIDSYDLAYVLADPSHPQHKSFWTLYDYRGQRSNLGRWNEALKVDLKSSEKPMTPHEILLSLFRIISGKDRVCYRKKNIIGGGAVFSHSDKDELKDAMHGEYYILATELQVKCLKNNSLLFVIDDVKEAKNSFEGATKLVRFGYPHAENIHRLLQQALPEASLWKNEEKNDVTQIIKEIQNSSGDNLFLKLMKECIRTDCKKIEELLQFSYDWQVFISKYSLSQSLEHLNYHVIGLSDDPLFSVLIYIEEILNNEIKIDTFGEEQVDLIRKISKDVIQDHYESNLLNRIIMEMLFESIEEENIKRNIENKEYEQFIDESISKQKISNDLQNSLVIIRNTTKIEDLKRELCVQARILGSKEPGGKEDADIFNDIIVRMILGKEGSLKINREKYIKWFEKKKQGMERTQEMLELFTRAVFNFNIPMTQLYQVLMAIHPFLDYNGRTLRVFFRVIQGYPLFLHCVEHDLLMSTEEFVEAEQEGKVNWFNVMASLKRECLLSHEQGKTGDYYHIPEIWLHLLDCTMQEWNRLNPSKKIEFDLDDAKRKKSLTAESRKVIDDIAASIKSNYQYVADRKRCYFRFVHHVKKHLKENGYNLVEAVKTAFLFYQENPSGDHLKSKFYISGTFNGWNKQEMKYEIDKNNNKIYKLDVTLFPRTYQFKLGELIDGSVTWLPKGYKESNIIFDIAVQEQQENSQYVIYLAAKQNGIKILQDYHSETQGNQHDRSGVQTTALLDSNPNICCEISCLNPTQRASSNLISRSATFSQPPNKDLQESMHDKTNEQKENIVTLTH